MEDGGKRLERGGLEVAVATGGELSVCIALTCSGRRYGG